MLVLFILRKETADQDVDALDLRVGGRNAIQNRVLHFAIFILHGNIPDPERIVRITQHWRDGNNMRQFRECFGIL